MGSEEEEAVDWAAVCNLEFNQALGEHHGHRMDGEEDAGANYEEEEQTRNKQMYAFDAGDAGDEVLPLSPMLGHEQSLQKRAVSLKMSSLCKLFG